jgi:hypothetical protein
LLRRHPLEPTGIRALHLLSRPRRADEWTPATAASSSSTSPQCHANARARVGPLRLLRFAGLDVSLSGDTHPQNFVSR